MLGDLKKNNLSQLYKTTSYIKCAYTSNTPCGEISSFHASAITRKEREKKYRHLLIMYRCTLLSSLNID